MFPKGRYQRMSQQASYQIKTSELVKVVASGWLGTAMEFMDFQLYSLAAAIVFNEIFFPESDPAMGLIMAMGTTGPGMSPASSAPSSSAMSAIRWAAARYYSSPLPSWAWHLPSFGFCDVL